MMTNTQREAMQQALEAINHGITEMNLRGCAIECMPLHYAAKALREALVEVPEATRLTDGEVWDIWNGEIGVDEMNQQEAFKFARAIEQAVRIK